MTHFSLTAYWRALPRLLAGHLLHASSGMPHCMRLGTLSLDLYSNGDLSQESARSLDFLPCAWEAAPDNADLAALLSRLPEHLSSLSARQRAVLRWICRPEHSPPEPLKAWSAADAAWREGDLAGAMRNYAAAGGLWLTPLERLGHCMARRGEREAALALWSKVLAARPWHTQLILSMHDYSRGYDAPMQGPPGPTAVLFYSWNKAEDLDAALQSLTASLDDVALVACLDNGSTDATPQVLDAWRCKIGEKFLPVTLPVNVGAAAARNWLISLPQVRALPFAAFVDDDALLPPHWLRHLARAVDLYPAASAWGCRVADAGDPHMTQSGPLHLIPNFIPEHGPPLPGRPDAPAPHLTPDNAFSPLLAKGDPFGVSDLLCAGPDFGALSYIRPCASVTGCCHLLRTAELVEHPFALQFSPSQYDDLERDLRMLAKGRSACYTGFCTVLHKKRTGGPESLSGPAYGNALGNHYKLHGLYDAAAVTAMVHAEAAALEEDLLARMARLEANHALC